jgi:hypothetical protein
MKVRATAHRGWLSRPRARRNGFFKRREIGRQRDISPLPPDARGVRAEFRAAPITNAKAAKSVVKKFREKYGAEDVKQYYSKLDVAILIERV